MVEGVALIRASAVVGLVIDVGCRKRKWLTGIISMRDMQERLTTPAIVSDVGIEGRQQWGIHRGGVISPWD